MATFNQQMRTYLDRVNYVLQQAYKFYDAQNIAELQNLAKYLTTIIHEVEAIVNKYDMPYNAWQVTQHNRLSDAQAVLEKAQQVLAKINSMISQLQGNSNADSRTNGNDSINSVSGLGDVNNYGDLMGYLRGEAANGNQAALDAFIKGVTNQAQMQWQRESDDLAYQRNNPSTLYATLVGLGMSPIAALSAASGSGIATQGSSLPLDGSSDFAGYGVAQDQLSLARQQQALQGADSLQGATSAMTDTIAQQQQLWQQWQALQAQYFDINFRKQGIEEIQRTYNEVYAMQACHLDVPLEATVSQTEFKKWLRDCNDAVDVINEGLANGTWAIDDAGTFYSIDGSFEPITAEHFQGLQHAANAFGEIQKHKGSIAYGTMFEQLFMSNAGPRAYHQQEDYSQLMRAQTAVGMLQVYNDELESYLDRADLESLAYGQVQAVLESVVTNDDFTTSPSIESAAMQAAIDKYGMTFVNGQLCWQNARVTVDSENGEQGDLLKPVSLRDMWRLGLINMPCSYGTYMQYKHDYMTLASNMNASNYRQSMATLNASMRAVKEESEVRVKSASNLLDAYDDWSPFMYASDVYNNSKLAQFGASTAYDIYKSRNARNQHILDDAQDKAFGILIPKRKR